MKDFYDLWLLSRQFEFDGRTLVRAVTATFANRKTALEPAPVALTPTFSKSSTAETQWRAFLRKGQFSNAPEQLVECRADAQIGGQTNVRLTDRAVGSELTVANGTFSRRHDVLPRS